MASLGNFSFAASLSAQSLADMVLAAEVLNQQFAITPPTTATASGTGIPISFAAMVDGQQVTFNRNPITSGAAVALVSLPNTDTSFIQSLWASATNSAPAPSSATDPPQPPAISGKGGVATIAISGQATTAGTTVPFSLTLAFFIRQARALEVTPAGFPALRACGKPLAQIPDILVAFDSNGQPVPAQAGIAGVFVGDLIRQFNDIDGIHDGLPLDQSTGTGLNQPTVVNAGGQTVQKYVISTAGGIAQLVDTPGKRRRSTIWWNAG